MVVEAWTESALINLNDGTTDMSIHAITDSIDIDSGEKGMEGIPTLGGGRIKKLTPQTDTTITFEGYPIAIGDKDATSSVLSGNYALRKNFANCEFISCKPTMSVGEPLKATYIFKCTPFTKAGVSNITEESTDSTASLGTI